MRAAWLPDTFAKVARIAGWKVDWVLNITDVGHLVGDGDDGEDKLEKSAREESKKVEEIVDFYTQDYLKQVDAIALDIPIEKMRPKATDHILGQMRLALQMVADRRAYILDDGIYFEAQANLDLNVPFELDKKGDNSFTGRTIENSQKAPADFALWKFVDESSLQKWKFNQFNETAQLVLKILSQPENSHNMDLPNRWGVPGWHSECVVMIDKLLGDGELKNDEGKSLIDVHFGGEDHIDIHHRNEILESEALGFHLSNYWVHNKFVLVDSAKMSKSLGNVFLVVGDKNVTSFESIAGKGFDPLSYRVMLMEHHYTSQLDFTWAKLKISQARLYNLRKECSKILSFARVNSIIVDKPINENQKQVLLEILLDNLDTPKFLGKFGDFVKDVSNEIATKSTLNPKNLAAIKFWEDEFLKLDLLPSLDSEILVIAEQRSIAKNKGDYQKADQLRDKILEKNIQIDDYAWGWGLWKK
ncbi:hypothetical protein HC864_04625 [Candidatus Gracilibacteria bacterium]|nr:hypothetical protein [Candidatus Gracilibacteria bacterium]